VQVEAVAWTQDGQFLMAGGLADGIVHVFRTSDWSEVTSFVGQDARTVEYIDVLGDLVLVAGEEGVVRLYRYTITPDTNVSPSVSLTSPAAGAVFQAPTDVVVEATASDPDGTIAQVEFLAGGVVLGTDTSSPYGFTWAGAPAGAHTLTARATDDGGKVTTSAAVNITVNAPPSSTGTGLLGSYYDDSNFSTFKLSRTDATVNFSWGSGSPDASIGADTFSVRWTGSLKPLYSQQYTFHVTRNDGCRLWVNNVLVIDKWTQKSGTYTGRITLTAGAMVPIRLEFFENTGSANVKLEWSSTSQARQVVPQAQLYASP
jgi:hypothetical protein